MSNVSKPIFKKIKKLTEELLSTKTAGSSVVSGEVFYIVKNSDTISFEDIENTFDYLVSKKIMSRHPQGGVMLLNAEPIFKDYLPVVDDDVDREIRRIISEEKNRNRPDEYHPLKDGI
jgi:hypothetical protein